MFNRLRPIRVERLVRRPGDMTVTIALWHRARLALGYDLARGSRLYLRARFCCELFQCATAVSAVRGVLHHGWHSRGTPTLGTPSADSRTVIWVRYGLHSSGAEAELGGGGLRTRCLVLGLASRRRGHRVGEPPAVSRGQHPCAGT